MTVQYHRPAPAKKPASDSASGFLIWPSGSSYDVLRFRELHVEFR